MSKEAENVALVQSLYAAFGRGDMETLFGALADDIEWILPGPPEVIPFAGTHRGREAVIQFFMTLSKTVQFETLEPYEFLAQGDKVVVLGRSRPRMQSTGRVVDNDWVAVITVRDGKLARYKIYEDTAALVSALQ